MPYKKSEDRRTFFQGYYEKNKEVIKERSMRWAKKYPDKANERSRQYHARLKQEVITAYGGKCVCCEESNSIFLTLDHVKNNGAEERRNGRGFGTKLYRKLKVEGYPADYQILCWNCNVGRHINKGVCPHDSEK